MEEPLGRQVQEQAWVVAVAEAHLVAVAPEVVNRGRCLPN
jgi:hypothetical protein